MVPLKVVLKSNGVLYDGSNPVISSLKPLSSKLWNYVMMNVVNVS